jgi:hypothetical protein
MNNAQSSTASTPSARPPPTCISIYGPRSCCVCFASHALDVVCAAAEDPTTDGLIWDTRHVHALRLMRGRISDETCVTRQLDIIRGACVLCDLYDPGDDSDRGVRVIEGVLMLFYVYCLGFSSAICIQNANAMSMALPPTGVVSLDERVSQQADLVASVAASDRLAMWAQKLPVDYFPGGGVTMPIALLNGSVGMDLQNRGLARRASSRRQRLGS